MTTITQQLPTLHVERQQQRLIFRFDGELSVHTTAAIWEQCFAEIAAQKPQQLILDAKLLTYCDGAGINLLCALKKHQITLQRYCQLENLTPKLQKLVQVFSEADITTTQHTVPHEKWLTSLGHETADLLKRFRANMQFMGEVIYYMFLSILHPSRIRWKDVWLFIEKTGPNALPIIALIGFLIGMIMSFQGAIALSKFGAKMFVPNFVAITLLRELTPLMTAIMVIGRSASAFAAELGNMQLNQEVDALRTMGLEPTPFLVIPRVIATMTMMPFLNLFMILFGLIGCGVVMDLLGVSAQLYINQLTDSLFLKDLIGGLFKSFVFGIVISSIGCMNGLRTRGGAMGVGDSTTRTVVSSIVMLAILDGLFAIIFYSAGL
ncbi:MAG: MlaE family lipid ABC transporter permease subunit [Gammaproteobacteria bacterium]|nr:MlaE family lipid ABC transporter permease subunit [Gammaproteobacteria bacterium]